eukprot:363506-Chlamydomonas_euryale.AAC.12
MCRDGRCAHETTTPGALSDERAKGGRCHSLAGSCGWQLTRREDTFAMQAAFWRLGGLTNWPRAPKGAPTGASMTAA